MTQTSNFEGFPVPTANYFSLPNEMINIIANISNLAELKVIIYVIRHTWGYQEYGTGKTITIDEFMYGRKRNDGSRIDEGTKLSKQSVVDGLKKAEQEGYLICDTDDTDKGRVRKTYRLRISGNIPDVKNLDTTPDEGRCLDSRQQRSKNLTSGYQNLDSNGLDSRHRSEKETLERNSRKTLEKERKANASVSQPTLLSEEKKSVNTRKSKEEKLVKEAKKTGLSALTEQEQSFWAMWLQVDQNKKVPPQYKDSAADHIRALAPYITTQEDLQGLTEFARQKSRQQLNLPTLWKIELGNLRNSFADWDQLRQKSSNVIPLSSKPVVQYREAAPYRPKVIPSSKPKRPLTADQKLQARLAKEKGVAG